MLAGTLEGDLLGILGTTEPEMLRRWKESVEPGTK
jgi:hypothetical protein